MPCKKLSYRMDSSNSLRSWPHWPFEEDNSQSKLKLGEDEATCYLPLEPLPRKEDLVDKHLNYPRFPKLAAKSKFIHKAPKNLKPKAPAPKEHICFFRQIRRSIPVVRLTCHSHHAKILFLLCHLFRINCNPTMPHTLNWPSTIG